MCLISKSFQEKKSDKKDTKMINYKINLQSYLKLLMHSLKYPFAKVNGLLLSKKASNKSKKDKLENETSNKSSNEDEIEFVDYIPLFHFNQGLTAMLEIALIQIQTYCSKHNLQIAGYFQGNKNFHDSSIDVFAQKIGEKLIELNSSASIVIVSILVTK